MPCDQALHCIPFPSIHLLWPPFSASSITLTPLYTSPLPDPLINTLPYVLYLHGSRVLHNPPSWSYMYFSLLVILLLILQLTSFWQLFSNTRHIHRFFTSSVRCLIHHSDFFYPIHIFSFFYVSCISSYVSCFILYSCFIVFFHH